MGGGGGGYTGGITKADKLKELAKQRISKLTGDEKETFNLGIYLLRKHTL
jgi:hypothetical protein